MPTHQITKDINIRFHFTCLFLAESDSREPWLTSRGKKLSGFSSGPQSVWDQRGETVWVQLLNYNTQDWTGRNVVLLHFIFSLVLLNNPVFFMWFAEFWDIDDWGKCLLSNTMQAFSGSGTVFFQCHHAEATMHLFIDDRLSRVEEEAMFVPCFVTSSRL